MGEKRDEVVKEYEEKIKTEFEVGSFIEFHFFKDCCYGKECYLNKIEAMLKKVIRYESLKEENRLERNKNEYNDIENDIQQFVEDVRNGEFITEYIWQFFGTMRQEGAKKIYESYKLLSDIATVKDGFNNFIEGYKKLKNSINCVIKDKEEKVEKLRKKDEEVGKLEKTIADLTSAYNDAKRKLDSFCNDVKNKQVKKEEGQRMKVKRLESALKNKESFKSYVLDKYGRNSREYNFLFTNNVNEKNSENKQMQMGLENKLGGNVH